MPPAICTTAGFPRSNPGQRKLSRRTSKKRASCCLEALESRLLLSTVSWIGASGSWSTPANWSTNTIPQPGDTVIISKSGSIQVTLTGNASVNSISVTGDTLTVSAGTLSVAGTSSINSTGTLVLSNAALTLATGATLTNGGAITVNPLSTLNAGSGYTQTSTGSLTLPSGSLTTGIGTNLLGDPGFESPSAGSSTTTEPSIWGNWGPSYISTAFAHTGTQSVQEPGTSGGSGVNQSFSATPGVSYTVSVYAMTPSSSKLTGPEEGILNLLFYNSAGTQVGSDGITVLTSNSATGGTITGSVGTQGWNFYTTSGVAPATAATVTVALQVGPYSGISGPDGGSVVWDDAQFGATAATSAVVTAASISNSGAITIGASDKINTTGTFLQSSTGTLTMQLGGPAAGLMFGTLNVGGAATLGGAFHAVLVNGYTPSVSDGFALLNYNTQTGAFSSTQLPSGASYTFQQAVNPTYLGISALPASLTTSVNIATAVGAETPNLVGVNLAYWDDKLTTTQTQSMVEAAGLNMFRFPGGSASDDFHFTNDDNYSDPSANSIPQFAQFVDNVGGVAIVTTDYGSGSPQEAEAELAYLTGSPTDTTVIGNGQEWSDTTNSWQTVNWQTVGYWASLRGATPLATNDGLNFLRVGHAAAYTGMNYWEIGNEQYGTWEIDHYSPTGVGGNATTGGYNYPLAYAQFAASFAAFVTADKLLPSISIGIDSGDPTGASDNNWTRNVLTDGFALGFVPGFISDHSYMQGPGSESDSFLLNDTVSNAASTLDWSTRYADYEAMLQATVGSSASSVHIMATEYNSNYGTEGKQMTSVVNGLFVADSIGSLLDSGYTGGVFWDLRNGWVTDGNNSPTLYGWRQGGDEGILGDPNITNDAPSTGPYITYPNYFGEELGSKLIQTGGTAISANSSYNELTVYSVLEANGHLDLMVINKNPDAAITDQFNLTGFTPSGQAQFWQYGEAQDYAQSQSPTGAASLANFNTMLAFTGDSFSYAFPAYSMTLIDLTPMLTVAAAAAANPNPVTSTTTALTALGSENDTGNGLTYTWSATGPAPVTYTSATNGTNAAQNITANFTQAGSYNFTATITDTGGLFITTSVAVTVNQTLTSITVTPTSATINEDANQPFAATAYDQFNNALANQPTFTWSVPTGIGSVNLSGLYASPAASGSATVQAASGLVHGSSTVTINNAAPTVQTAATANPTPVTGTSTALSVLGADDGGEANLSYTWSDIGPAGVTYTGNTNGTNASKNITANFTQAGSYNFTVTITDSGGLSTTSMIAVVVQQTPINIVVSPSSSPVVPVGFAQQFSAAATDQFGNPITSFAWAITGSGNSIDGTGNATLGSTPGSFIVTASDGSVQGIATIVAENFAVPSSSTLDINLGPAGPVGLSASGNNITASQNGVQITLSGFTGITVTDTASNDALNFNGPLALPFTFVDTGTSTVNVISGTLSFAADMGGTISLGTLSVANGASAAITAATTNTPTTLSLSTLLLGTNGTLDVANNIVLINYGSGTSPISTIAGWIATGYAGGTWIGPGIISSTAQTNPNYGLGYADSADTGNPANLPTGEIKIMYTLLGDANLDGTVNSEDFTPFSHNEGLSGMMWDDGDFNYDGTVNSEDFTPFSQNLGQSAQIAATALVKATTLSTASTPPAASTIASPVLVKHLAKAKPKHGRKA